MRFLSFVLGIFQSRFDFSLTSVEEADGVSDSDSEDGPTLVDMEDIEQSNARLSMNKTVSTEVDSMVKEKYPLLFAAIMPNEDVLMTCARALDDAQDVSLVREAAAYLEQVEAVNRQE